MSMSNNPLIPSIYFHSFLPQISYHHSTQIIMQHNADYVVTYFSIIHINPNFINIFCSKSADELLFY